MEPSQPPQESDVFVEHTPAPRERGVFVEHTERLHCVFIVTSYGCNSTPSDLWVPHSKIFMKYDEAYAYFLKMSPPLDDEDNIAEQVVNDTYKEDDRTKEYVIIENRVELAGYHCGDGRYAKRPRGAVIARSIIQ
jgi:hypothetical protein